MYMVNNRLTQSFVAGFLFWFFNNLRVREVLSKTPLFPKLSLDIIGALAVALVTYVLQ